MERIKKTLIALLVFVPIIIALKNFFDLSNPLVWGDAPYFYSENLKELFNIPFAWDTRNSNFGNSRLLTLWLYIPTFLQGALFYLFKFNHEISIRIVFYFSYLFSSLLGIYLLLSKFKFNFLAKTFGIFFYILNTYSLVLLDGGQIGVLLSYGLFPFVFFSFSNFIDKKSAKNFLIILLTHFLIFNTDLRIAIILVLFESVWWLLVVSKKSIMQTSQILLVYLVVIALSYFWVLPFLNGLKSGSENSISLGQPNFIQLSYSFYLFQPHFPNNDFGNLNKTPIYFIFLPLILFLGVLNKSRKTILIGLMLLMFMFLAKGYNPPFGEIYSFLINLPLGNAFRDSSKFYIPAILLGSFLIGFTVEFIHTKFKKFKILWLGLIYTFLLISIYPIFFGKLTGVLGQTPNKQDFQQIYELIKNENANRTLWFVEKPPLGYADWNHPAVSANLLFRERPFASMIDGDYDLFGFLHNPKISNWYELLGIKYIFYPPNERKKSLTNKEKRERKQFEDFISKVPGLNKLDLNISFPVYETENPLPKIFGQKKFLFVLGGDEIYQKLWSSKKYDLKNSGIVFLESCKFDPQILYQLDPKTFGFIKSDDINDLYLSFFCDDFISPLTSRTKQWAINGSANYLNWKSQLLERGVRNYDYDFDKGLAYSTRPDEKLQFEIQIPKTQNYYLVMRFLTASKSAGLRVDFENNSYILKSKKPDKLEWKLIRPLSLSRGGGSITVTNLGGLSVFNTLGLIPQTIFDRKKEELDNKLQEINVVDANDPNVLNSFLPTAITPLNYKMINPTEYEVEFKSNVNWLVFSERFDNNWRFDSINPVPLYSMINGYYTANMIGEKTFKLYYQPQGSVKLGVKISIVVLLLVGFALIFHIIRRGGYFRKFFSNSKN